MITFVLTLTLKLVQTYIVQSYSMHSCCHRKTTVKLTVVINTQANIIPLQLFYLFLFNLPRFGLDTTALVLEAHTFSGSDPFSINGCDLTGCKGR